MGVALGGAARIPLRKKSNPQKIRDSGLKKMKKKIRWLKNPSPLVKAARFGGFTIDPSGHGPEPQKRGRRYKGGAL